MRSLVLSLVFLAGAATHVAAQRPSITRPIQQAREAAAKSGARTATAEAAGMEPIVSRDSVGGSAPVTRPAATTSSVKSPPANAATTGAKAPPAATNGTKASPATGSATAPATATNGAAATSTAASDANATSDKAAGTTPPPQVARGKTAPAGSKSPVKEAAAATPAAAAAAPRDTAAATVSVGSAPPTRPELRIDREVFTYDAGGRRDPFVSLFSTSDLRPLFSDLLLVVINYDPQRRNSVAIMRDATTKEQYRVRQGQLIGRMRVAAIEPKRVLFTIDEFGFSRQESLVIGDTTKVRKQ